MVCTIAVGMVEGATDGQTAETLTERLRDGLWMELYEKRHGGSG